MALSQFKYILECLFVYCLFVFRFNLFVVVSLSSRGVWQLHPGERSGDEGEAGCQADRSYAYASRGTPWRGEGVRGALAAVAPEHHRLPQILCGARETVHRDGLRGRWRPSRSHPKAGRSVWFG